MLNRLKQQKETQEHTEQPKTGTASTWNNKPTKTTQPNSRLENQTKAIKPGSEFGDSRDEQDQFYPLSVSQIL